MARQRCFEVIKLKFTFYHTKKVQEKVKLVSDGMEKYLKKFASDTNYEISHSLDTNFDTDVIVDVKLSKDISANTVNNILANMLGEKVHQLIYTKSSKELRISILR